MPAPTITLRHGTVPDIWTVLSLADSALTEPPFMCSWNAFSTLINDHCRAIDRNLNLTALDTEFIAVTAGRRVSKFDPAKSLSRYKFMALITRTALKKFRTRRRGQSGAGQPTEAQAVQRMLGRFVLPNAERFDVQTWRERYLYCEEIDMLFKRDLEGLHRVYGKFSGKFALPGETAVMSLQEFVELIDHYHLQDATLTAVEALLSFVCAQMTSVDEMMTDDSLNMSFR